jgi:hypothetical protein
MLLLAFSVVTCVGCSTAVDSSVAQPAATAPASPADQEQAEIAEALAALSEEDRELAVQQKICPVGGGALGSMGTPVKVDMDGTWVFICCDGCEGVLTADPQKYLAKLAK